MKEFSVTTMIVSIVTLTIWVCYLLWAVALDFPLPPFWMFAASFTGFIVGAVVRWLGEILNVP